MLCADRVVHEQKEDACSAQTGCPYAGRGCLLCADRVVHEREREACSAQTRWYMCGTVLHTVRTPRGAGQPSCQSPYRIPWDTPSWSTPVMVNVHADARHQCRSVRLTSSRSVGQPVPAVLLCAELSLFIEDARRSCSSLDAKNGR